MKISAEKALVAFEATFTLTVIAVLGLAWYSMHRILDLIEASPLLQMILG